MNFLLSINPLFILLALLGLAVLVYAFKALKQVKWVLLVVLLAFAGLVDYKLFFAKDEPVNVSQAIAQVTPVRYSADLRIVHDAVFSPLDKEMPNPTAELTRLRGLAVRDLQDASTVRAAACRAVIRLCDMLMEANKEREASELRLKTYMSKDYGFGKMDPGTKDYDAVSNQDAERKRQFFVTSEHEKWRVYVADKRPACEKHLTFIQSRE